MMSHVPYGNNFLLKKITISENKQMSLKVELVIPIFKHIAITIFNKSSSKTVFNVSTSSKL